MVSIAPLRASRLHRHEQCAEGDGAEEQAERDGENDAPGHARTTRRWERRFGERVRPR